ncbi:MAG TPA: hypothetical protein VHB20_18945 [Verrucomicrobiae bacterium]|nr:hypothetical protein [Verrucomicrobiae bacterium]
MAVTVGVCGAVGQCAAADSIAAYSAPKDPPALTQVAAQAPAPGVQNGAPPIGWTTPAGWTELPATVIRIGNFLVPGEGGKKAEVAISSFPGAVGTEFDNVNRWRREIGLEPIQPDGISSKSMTVAGLEGKLYEFAGESENTVVGSLPREGRTWFFKLRGDKNVVDAAKPAFLEFLKTIHFNGSDAPIDQAAPVAKEAGEPDWTVPANWEPTPAGSMILKSFSVTGEGGQKAKITVSTFPGKVGGVLSNVNRWRAQLGLGPISAAELPGVTEPLPAAGAEAILVCINNTNMPAGHASSLIAAMAPREASTWFYKLSGDSRVVAREKEAFVKFVASVRYHEP